MVSFLKNVYEGIIFTNLFLDQCLLKAKSHTNVLWLEIEFRRGIQARNQGRGSGGLDSCPFQQKNENTLFCRTLSIQKGVSITLRRREYKNFPGVSSLTPHIPFPTLIGKDNSNNWLSEQRYQVPQYFLQKWIWKTIFTGIIFCKMF